MLGLELDKQATASGGKTLRSIVEGDIGAKNKEDHLIGDVKVEDKVLKILIHLQRTYAGHITLREWAELGVKTTAKQLDALWTGAALEDGTNMINNFAHLSYADRMDIWNEALIQKEHARSLQPLANRQVKAVAEDATDTLECSIQSKRKMQQGGGTPFFSKQRVANLDVIIWGLTLWFGKNMLKDEGEQSFQDTANSIRMQFPNAKKWLYWHLNPLRGKHLFPALANADFSMLTDNTNAQERLGGLFQRLIGKKEVTIMEAIDHTVAWVTQFEEKTARTLKGQALSYGRKKKRSRRTAFKNDGRPPDTTKDLFPKRLSPTPKDIDWNTFGIPWSFSFSNGQGVFHGRNSCSMDTTLMSWYLLRRFKNVQLPPEVIETNAGAVLEGVMKEIGMGNYDKARWLWLIPNVSDMVNDVSFSSLSVEPGKKEQGGKVAAIASRKFSRPLGQTNKLGGQSNKPVCETNKLVDSVTSLDEPNNAQTLLAESVDTLPEVPATVN
ncbi:hypothetical protein B0O80DRAFT_504308 [Mortierella sp. GBAus27b]|nr:hypothetical protein B0O80DRAFT_504308 [Mortierella sp. GBAus27b]